MITPQRGRELTGRHVAVRYRWSGSGWILDMPVRDRKFGVLGCTTFRWQQASEMVPASEHDTAPERDEYRWFYVRYGWSHGIYIGKVAKQEGTKIFVDYDSGNILDHHKRKTITFGCVALKGVRDGFVLAYIPLTEGIK